MGGGPISDSNATNDLDHSIIEVRCTEYSGFSPDPSSAPTGERKSLLTDASGNLQTRGQTLTDEGSFRDDFGADFNQDDWDFVANGIGASNTVANSKLTSVSGANSGNYVGVTREVDYGPMSIYTDFSINARRTNQEVYVGLMDAMDLTASVVCSKGAYILFDGINPYILKFITRSSSDATDAETTTIVLDIPTTQEIDYQIDVSGARCSLAVNGAIVASHTDHIPGPQDILKLCYGMRNTGATSSTTCAVHVVYVANYNKVDINTQGFSQPISVKVVNDSSSSQAGFSDGFVATSAITTVPCRSTAYTEQTSNAQRSIASSSANDASAGTGARTVRIIYLNESYEGPFFETVTLNGTTGVNTVATDICFIEKIEVLTVGSGGTAAGTISLYTAINKGGSVFASIAAANTRTFWSHHYVPSGRTCHITTAQLGTNGTVVGNGLNGWITSQNRNLANSVIEQISPNYQVPGSQPLQEYSPKTPLFIAGPAFVVAYVKPASTASLNNYFSFDFYED